MTDVPDLTPYSFDTLLSRIAHEWDRRHRVFDLPTARFWSPHPETDLSMKFLGRPAATPVGPAAGPHSQMAQNIVLGWLAEAEQGGIQFYDHVQFMSGHQMLGDGLDLVWRAPVESRYGHRV